MDAVSNGVDTDEWTEDEWVYYIWLYQNRIAGEELKATMAEKYGQETIDAISAENDTSEWTEDDWEYYIWLYRNTEDEDKPEEEEDSGESGSTSKYLEQLDNLSENKINHMINGSKNSNHGWEKLVPDKNWSDIKNIIANVMDTGVEGPYKSVFSKKATINGFEVEVTYTKLSDGTIKISDAWVNQ